MGKVKVVLNRAEVARLMKSPEMQSFLMAEAEKMTKMTGTQYRSVYVGKTRANVQTEDPGNVKGVTHTESKKKATHKKAGSWVTRDGQKTYVKGYKRGNDP